jgi:hypothetical protein
MLGVEFMRIIRSFLGFILILLIIAGVGYIGYSFWVNPGMRSMLGMNGMNSGNSINMNNMNNMNSTTMSGIGSSNMNMQGNNMNGMNMNGASTGTQINQLALQNKDALDQFITQLTDAVNQITIDPYSSITANGGTPGTNVQPNGGTTINVYPNASNPVNVMPGSNSNNQTQSANTSNMGANIPTVYNQYKLEQVHTGIYRLSQGMMMLNELGDDLTAQSAIIEPAVTDYSTYLLRYNSALSNKTKLNSAMNLLNSATTLINVNPYAGAYGFQYDPTAMENFHKGIFKLAQAMRVASKISDNYTAELSTAANNLNNYGSMYNMNMYTGSGYGSFFNFANVPFIFTVILIVMIIALVIGIFGTIRSMFKPKKTKQ